MAAGAVHDQLADTHHQLTAAVLELSAVPDEALRLWRRDTAATLQRLADMRSELGRDNVIDVARAVTVHAELALLCRRTAALIR